MAGRARVESASRSLKPRLQTNCLNTVTAAYMYIKFMCLFTCLFIVLAMATKTKFVFLLICCLLLTNIAEGSRLTRCLKACNKGSRAIRKFCRSLKFVAPPPVRAACWANELTGPTACRGFCYRFFSKN